MNPLPLLLAATWRLDAGEVDLARALYDRARAIGAPGRLDLEPRFIEVESPLSEARDAVRTRGAAEVTGDRPTGP